MKFAKLLVLSALWLTASSAMATEIADVRQKPAYPKTQGFEVSETTEKYFYLFNIGAKGFFTQGNAWGTQASVDDLGRKMCLTEVYEGVYNLNQFNWRESDLPEAWRYVFFDNDTQMFCDRASQNNYFWGVEVNEAAGTFRLYAASADDGNQDWAPKTDADGNEVPNPVYKEGMFVGLDASKSGTALSPYLAPADDHYIDWAMVTEENYAPYAAAIEVYNAGQVLKAALEAADAVGANITQALEIYNNLESTPDALTKAADGLKPITEARKTLKSYIDEVKGKGYTETAAAEAVFANGDATVAELQKALEELTAAYTEWGKGHATLASPSDMSSMITNPNFDGASSAGWSGTSPNMVGSGSHGPANVAETWNNTFDMYQDIKGLPAGIYALGAKTSWRGSWNDMENGVGPAAFLYTVVNGLENTTPFNYIWACYNTTPMGGNTSFGTGAGENSETRPNEDGENVTYYSPNDPSAFRLYEEAGYYDTKVLFAVDNTDVRIGVKNPAMKGDADNWSCYDTFTLTYYGAAADACQYYFDEVLKTNAEVEIEDGVIYTESYLTAYQEKLSGETKVSSLDDIFAIQSGYEALQQNITLWKKWMEVAQNAFNKYVVDDKYQYCESVGDLADLVEPTGEYEEILDEHSWTNEELEASIAYINELVAKIIEEQKTAIKEGDDVTYMLENPDFEHGVLTAPRPADPNGNGGDYGTATGWHADKYYGGNFTPGPAGYDNDPSVNHAFESWHCRDFDFWQEVENAPEGVYVINVQGYVRNETSGTVTEYDPSIIPIKLYMNNSTANFPDVFSEEVPEDKYDENGNLPVIESHSWNGAIPNYPNSMGAAGLCFDWGMYKVQTYGLVKKGDNMRIGVKGKMDGDWWCIWDNFQLTYQGYNPEYVEPALDEALAQISLDKPMGKGVYEEAAALNEKAAEAKATKDGKTMFQMLADITDVSAAISESVTLFARLNAANETFQEAIQNGTNEIEKATAQALHDQIDAGIENHQFDDPEVYGLLEMMAKLTTRVNLPEDMANASDDNEVECTSVIINPTYADGNDDGWTGGAGGAGNGYMNAEMFNKSFNYYQTIQGLDEGTYAVTVQAYFRRGGATEDYDDFIENGNKNTNAYLYAVGVNDTVSVPLLRLASEAVATDAATAEELPSDWVFAKNPVEGVGGLMVPNMMSTASEAFNGFYGEENNYSGNRVVVKVGANGKLTIGLIKKENVNNDWVIWSNWQLFFYGPNSAKAESENAMLGISSLDADAQQPAKVEFFSLNGARLSAPAKGIVIMRQTMGDGTVKVRKLMIK